MKNWIAAACLVGCILGWCDLTCAQADEDPQGASPDRLDKTRAVANIKSRLSQMSAVERDRLERQRQQFDRLSDSDQEKMRKLHERLCNDPEGDRLFQVLQHYREWLTTLSPGERDDLMAKEPAARAVAIAKMKTQQDARNFAHQADGLSESDATSVFRWIEGYVNKHQSVLMEHIPQEVKRRLGRLDEQRRAQAMVFAVARHRAMRHLPEPTDEDFELLMPQLSSQAKQKLESAEQGAERVEMIKTWIEASWQARFQYAKVDRESLQRFFREQLTAEDREQLERLPAKEMHERLLWMYRSRRQFRGIGRPPPPPGQQGSPRDGRPPRRDSPRRRNQ